MYIGYTYPPEHVRKLKVIVVSKTMSLGESFLGKLAFEENLYGNLVDYKSKFRRVETKDCIYTLINPSTHFRGARCDQIIIINDCVDEEYYKKILRPMLVTIVSEEYKDLWVQYIDYKKGLKYD